MAPGGGSKTCAFVSWPGGHLQARRRFAYTYIYCHGCGPTKMRLFVLLLITFCVTWAKKLVFASPTDTLQHCCGRPHFCSRHFCAAIVAASLPFFATWFAICLALRAPLIGLRGLAQALCAFLTGVAWGLWTVSGSAQLLMTFVELLRRCSA